jgi:hypothetical protein
VSRGQVSGIKVAGGRRSLSLAVLLEFLPGVVLGKHADWGAIPGGDERNRLREELPPRIVLQLPFFIITAALVLSATALPSEIVALCVTLSGRSAPYSRTARSKAQDVANIRCQW